ncbi:MAG: hypothetical protein GY723_01590 [bacterium]|nr:hypothetical protein [bacterium]
MFRKSILKHRHLMALLTALMLAPACGGGSTSGSSREEEVEEVIPVEEVAPTVREFVGGPGALWGTDLDGFVPALLGFNLAYSPTAEHNASNIMVGGVSSSGGGIPNLDSFLMGLNDDDGGSDSVHMSARTYDVRRVGPRLHTSDTGLSGTARLPITIAPGEMFLLSGFAFQTEGSNHHIRVLRIEPFPDRGYVEVEYRDDSPGDDTYAATILYVVVPTSRGPSSTLLPHFGAQTGILISFSGTTDRPRPPTGMSAITGFHLEFRGGDRKLSALSVATENATGTPRYIATFKDQDVDIQSDVVDATIWYLPVNP